MFKRIILEDWHNLLPMVGFTFFFVIFLYLSMRAILMKRSKVEEIANLPFEDEITEESLKSPRHE